MRIVTGQTREEAQAPTQVGLILGNIQDLVKERFRRAGIQLTWPSSKYQDADLKAQLMCTPSQVAQALYNILDNAFDICAVSVIKQVKVELIVDPNEVILRITDSGPGVSEDIREKIFNPFFTTKEIGKGVGLGLSVAKSLVETNGGHLEFDSDALHGSFSLHFPRWTETDSSDEKKAV